ncbi:MAG: hypothetical protein ACRBCT_10290, partial [Alphaproteobacteria bacterium]
MTTTLTKPAVIEFLKEHQDDTDLIEALLPEKQRPRKGQPADFQAYAIERLRTEREEVIESTREVIE